MIMIDQEGGTSYSRPPPNWGPNCFLPPSSPNRSQRPFCDDGDDTTIGIMMRMMVMILFLPPNRNLVSKTSTIQ